ncbi:MAG TPA: ABC transporter permease subunit [Candidatus Sulfotelmatobacter sp.]|nr:ABC transporter permease subunit [Candidatus Sulfotelmatobacter sp.]
MAGLEGLSKAAAGPSARRIAAALPVHAIVSFGALAVVWEIVAQFTPPYLFPDLRLILKALVNIFTTWDLLLQGLITWSRLIGAVLASLVIGVPIGVAMGLWPGLDAYVRPVVKFIMGVPALNWVIIVIIWFTATEVRIGFVMLVLATPITIFTVYDGVRAIDQKLIDMVKTFGAGAWHMIRILVWPYVTAQAFTATKINVGVGVRTVIVAELVGASSGIGKELDLAKNMFDMPVVLAWTLWMIVMLLVLQALIEALERRVLRWRVEEGGKT